jgi:hypothetical protein
MMLGDISEIDITLNLSTVATNYSWLSTNTNERYHKNRQTEVGFMLSKNF